MFHILDVARTAQGQVLWVKAGLGPGKGEVLLGRWAWGAQIVGTWQNQRQLGDLF